MAASARVFASLPNKQHERLSQLADAKGLSISRLLAGLVERELAENPEERVQRLIAQAQDDRAPAEKYTVRLTGIDAARLEARAQGRSLTPSGYVAQLLRAHLRANPSMPYKEFEELRRVVNELAGIRGALQQLAAHLSGHSEDAKAAERGGESDPLDARGRLGLYAQEARGRQAEAASREWR